MPDLLLKNASLIDETGRVFPDRDLFIGDGVILSIRDSGGRKTAGE